MATNPQEQQTTMNRYRKKPVVIEAVQFTGVNHVEVCDFLGGQKGAEHQHYNDEGGVEYEFDAENGTVGIFTLEGEMQARPGDWIIKGVKGEFYPCKPDIFDATYEPV